MTEIVFINTIHLFLHVRFESFCGVFIVFINHVEKTKNIRDNPDKYIVPGITIYLKQKFKVSSSVNKYITSLRNK